jgi:hypothetical protein
MKQIRQWLLLFVLSGFCSLTQAATTTIWPNPHEPGFISAGGTLDTIIGLSNLQRVDDNFDQWWAGPSIVDIQVIAKHAAYTQDFGYIDALNNYTSLLSNITVNYGQTASFDTVNSGSPFRFGLDPSDAPLFSSYANDNPDNGLDHMVTWRITNGAHAGDYIIAWEDLYYLGDRDYNDLVLHVSGVNPVPIPAAVWLFVAGLIGLVGVARRKLF